MKKDLRVLIGEKLNMSQLCELAPLKDKGILGYIKRGEASRARQVIVSPCSTPSEVLCPSLEYPVKEARRAVGASPE